MFFNLALLIGIFLYSPWFSAILMIASPIFIFYFWGFHPLPFLVVIVLNAIIYFGLFLPAVNFKLN